MTTKIASWDDLKKTRECLFDIGNGQIVKLRGITEKERLKCEQSATETKFNRELKKDEEKLNLDKFNYYLLAAGWVEPEIKGETFEEKKEVIQELGFAVLQKIAEKIYELSGVSRGDIEVTKNVFGL